MITSLPHPDLSPTFSFVTSSAHDSSRTKQTKYKNHQTNKFTYLNCSVLNGNKKKETEKKKLYIMTPSCQFRQTLHIEGGKKTILTGTHHHGEPGLPSTTVLATASPGILAPHRWGSLIRVGAHPRVLGIIKHCRFFWRRRMRAQGIVGRTQRSYSLRGWRPCSESKLYFTAFHPPS